MPVQWWAVIFSGIGTCLAIVTFIVMLTRTRKEQNQAITKDLASLHERMTTLETKMGFFWRLVEEHMATLLKKPTHYEMDLLLDKLAAHTLTLEECYQLRRWVHDVYLGDARSPHTQKLIASLVMAAINALVIELERSKK